MKQIQIALQRHEGKSGSTSVKSIGGQPRCVINGRKKRTIPGQNRSRGDELGLDLALDVNNTVGFSLGSLKERARFAGQQPHSPILLFQSVLGRVV
jgi:hypothetical protein